MGRFPASKLACLDGSELCQRCLGPESRPSQAAAVKVPFLPTDRADDLHPAGIEIGGKRSYRWCEHQPPVSGHSSQDGPVRYWAGSIAAAPPPSAHSPVSGSIGNWRLRTPITPVGCRGARPRGQRYQRSGRRPIRRSATNTAPQRRPWFR